MAQSELQKEMAERIARVKPALTKILTDEGLDFLILVTFKPPSSLITIPVASNEANMVIAAGCSGVCIDAIQAAVAEGASTVAVDCREVD